MISITSISNNGIILEKNIPKKIYGKIETETTVFLSTLGLKTFASFMRLPERDIKKLFADFGLAEKDELCIIKRTMKRISGTSVKVYPIKID